MVFSRLLIFCFFAVSRGSTFACLGSCSCSIENEVINCEDTNRTQLSLSPVDDRMIGYTVINLRKNNIVNLPAEEILLEKFPDLKSIQLTENRHFNCSSLPEYHKVNISSDCVTISEVEVYSPENLGEEKPKPTGKGFWVLLLEFLKERYEKFDSREAAIKLRDVTIALADVFTKLLDIMEKVSKAVGKAKAITQNHDYQVDNRIEIPDTEAWRESGYRRQEVSDESDESENTTPPVQCDDDYTELDQTGYCYKKIYHKTDFNGAQRACESEDANLASIHSEEENEFLADLSRRDNTIYDNHSVLGLDQEIWIGLHFVSGKWEWIDGTPVDFEKWAVGEPNRMDHEVQVTMVTSKLQGYSQDGSHWNNAREFIRQKGFICKKAPRSLS